MHINIFPNSFASGIHVFMVDGNFRLCLICKFLSNLQLCCNTVGIVCHVQLSNVIANSLSRNETKDRVETLFIVATIDSTISSSTAVCRGKLLWQRWAPSAKAWVELSFKSLRKIDIFSTTQKIYVYIIFFIGLLFVILATCALAH